MDICLRLSLVDFRQRLLAEIVYRSNVSGDTYLLCTLFINVEKTLIYVMLSNGNGLLD